MTSVPPQSIKTPTLTPLQHEILVLVVNGLTNREIAARLGLTPGKVGIQVGRIVQKLGLHHRAEIAERRQLERSWGRDQGKPEDS